MANNNEIIDDPIKSTLFGKFYEKIILKWLENKGYEPCDGKPRIYWNHVEYAGVDNENSIAKRLNEVLKKYKENKIFCTPDGLLKKEDKYYVCEAKNWPLWTEGREPLDQLRDLLSSMPQILANKVVYRNQEYGVAGFLFFWWSKPENVDSLLEEICDLLDQLDQDEYKLTFTMFYTKDILKECIKNKYEWYLEIIKKEKDRIDKFFCDLLGES